MSVASVFAIVLLITSAAAYGAHWDTAGWFFLGSALIALAARTIPVERRYPLETVNDAERTHTSAPTP